MKRRTRLGTRLSALLATTVLMVLSGAVASHAGKDLPAPVNTPPADSQSSGQVITVSVWGDGSKGGSSSSGGGGSVSVNVPAPCWMNGWSTGKEFYDYVHSGQMARDSHHFAENITPMPGYEAYKDDETGQWYSAECSPTV